MDAGPLAGCRVLLTRPAEQATPWRLALEAAGAVVIGYPTIEVGPPPDFAPLDAALAHLTDYDWLLFTSVNALRFTAQRWPASLPPATLTRPRVAAVGGETARAIEAFGLRVACRPERESQDGLLVALGELPAGTQILFPQAIGGRDTLPSELRARGCAVDVVPASTPPHATTCRRPLRSTWRPSPAHRRCGPWSIATAAPPWPTARWW